MSVKLLQNPIEDPTMTCLDVVLGNIICNSITTVVPIPVVSPSVSEWGSKSTGDVEIYIQSDALNPAFGQVNDEAWILRDYSNGVENGSFGGLKIKVGGGGAGRYVCCGSFSGKYEYGGNPVAFPLFAFSKNSVLQLSTIMKPNEPVVSLTPNYTDVSLHSILILNEGDEVNMCISEDSFTSQALFTVGTWNLIIHRIDATNIIT